jgi:NO-binding membrane sensor protein with MHYT domain
VLSLFVAFQGSTVGLQLARGVAGVTGVTRRRRITGAAISLARAIWTMHFVGMLAARLPIAVDFLVLPTLLSFLVCALVVGFAVFFVALKPPTAGRITLAAGFMGAGIVSMHYLGMQALHASLHMSHDGSMVVLSAAIGVGASAAALWFGFGSPRSRTVLLPAAIMALAISAMHYTAMAGTILHAPEQAGPPGLPALSPGLLAIVVSLVAFLVTGWFLLTFVPEGEAESEAGAALPGPDRPPGLEVGRRETTDIVAPDAGTPAGGAATGGAGAARSLPVERDGYRRQLDLARIRAIQADGHYTRLYDGDALWFCPLSISDVESRLDPALFARIHRSHIVRLDSISALRKQGDGDLVAAMAGNVPYRAPVARARRSWLRQRLADTQTA